MAQDLTLYSNPMSRGRIAHWMLEEVGAPYRVEFIELGAENAGYRAINPLGKVPAIRHGERIVTECAAICAYLADAFPEAELSPPPGERADYYRWMFFAAGPLEAVVVNRMLGVEVPKERKLAVGYAPYDLMLDTLEMAVSTGPYVAGDRFSAADVYVGSHIGWGLRSGGLAPRPAFQSYLGRLIERPAFRRAAAANEAAMASAGA